MRRKKSVVRSIIRLGAVITLCFLATGMAPALAQTKSYTITASVDNEQQGSIEPSGAIVVSAGGSQTFLITAKLGFKAYLQVDGKTQAEVQGYTFTNVSSNHTIAVHFSRMTYTVKAVSGPNGTMSPNALVRVEHGDSLTFAVTPNPGYKTADVVVDEVSKGPIETYSFVDIQSDHSITVSFVALNGEGDSDIDPGKAGGITDLTGFISAQGLFVQPTTALSSDNMARLVVTRGTFGLTVGGQPLTQIAIVTSPEPPPQPEGSRVIGNAYDVKPFGATLDLPGALLISYDPARIPAGVSQERLLPVAWDEAARVWAPVADGSVNTATQTVYAPLTRFGRYAVVAPMSQAHFAVTDLTVSPPQIGAEDTAIVRVLVSNTGDLAGTFTVTLKVDGAIRDTRNVNLAGGASETATFSVSGTGAGNHAISVEGLSTAVMVTETPPNPAKPQTTNWAQMMGIIAGIIGSTAMVAVMIMILVIQRRGKAESNKSDANKS